MIRRLVKIFAVLAIVFAVGYAFRLQLLPWAADCLDVGRVPQRVDCVMALPGDSERRPFVAAAMMNVGLADRAIIPKNAESPEETDGLAAPSCEVARRIYEARGIASERIIILEGATQSTIDDLELLTRYLDRNPNATAGVVTNAYHTRRTQWTLQTQFPEHASRIIVISAPNSDFDAATWWRSDAGFVPIIFEHLKLAFYWLRYGTGLYWVVGLFLVTGSVAIYRRFNTRRVRAASGDRNARPQ